MKKTVSVILILVALLTSTVAAAPPGIQPRFIRIWYMSAGILIESNGKATLEGTVSLYDKTDKAELKVQLQQKNGTSWTPVRTISGTDYGWAVKTGTWYVMSGYWYRVEVFVKVWDADGNLLESTSRLSNEHYY